MIDSLVIHAITKKSFVKLKIIYAISETKKDCSNRTVFFEFFVAPVSGYVQNLQSKKSNSSSFINIYDIIKKIRVFKNY